LAAGSTTVDCAANNNYQPRNADGGLIDVQSLANFTEITGMGGSYVVCSDAILGRLAKQVDLTLDDGVEKLSRFCGLLFSIVTDMN
jgi:hypothetical protein|tara:strand:+ start:1039 stop:1296 length:258 start_codon:yes stop_codon:yes gene_type:complete